MPAFPTTPIAKLTGHNGPVHAVAYSAGSAQYILTGSTDRLIRLYNPSRAPTSSSPDSSTTPPGLVQTYPGHAYEVLDVAVAPDNARFASAGGDKLVYVWDVAAARTLRRFEGHAGKVNAVAWGGDGGSVVASGSFDAAVKLWDLKSQSYKPLITLSEARDSVSSVAISGWEVYAGSVDGRLRVYDIRTGAVSTDVIGHPVTSATPTKAGDSVLISTLDSTLRLMDKSTGKLLQAYRAPNYTNTTYRLRSTLGQADTTILSGSESGALFVWDLVSGNVLHELRHGAEAPPPSVAVGGKPAEAKTSSRNIVSAVAYCPARAEWCSGGGDGNVVVWGTAEPRS
ncbi:WD40 repeat-like protein [Trichodelitschia bisporula]|uniref:WD40 repeat-like protein n=1 Tax=Trichodelitschia bisporula TaxID=703511 RepID=A0A6G1I4D7_9PEZI|nr:WD40 repeat-like protein [Trichodelitschia bisporula]